MFACILLILFTKHLWRFHREKKVGATIGARTEPKTEDIIATATRARAHTHFKNNWMYDNKRKHWYSFWCRWNPKGDLLTRFYAERILVPDGKGGTIHRNVYHFTDGRGTIQDGPLCGPWLINEACSKEDGLIHPSRDYLRMFMGPKGAAAWITPVLSLGGPVVTELFLHHDENLRMSVGMVWNEQGDLQSVALIREDARGPFPSAYWSESAAARVVSPEEMLRLIVGKSSVAEGIGNVTLSNLFQDAVFGVNLFSTRIALAHKRRDLVMMMNADNVAVVAPKKKKSDLSVAIVWRLKHCIRTMEVQWMDNVFTKIRILRFDIIPSPPAIPFGMSIHDAKAKRSPPSIPSPNTRAQIEHVQAIPRLPSPKTFRGPPDVFSPRQSSPVQADWVDRVPAGSRPISPLNLRMSPRSSATSDSTSSSVDLSRSPESHGIGDDVFQFSPSDQPSLPETLSTSGQFFNLAPNWMSEGAPPAERMRLPVRSVSYTPHITGDSFDSEPDQIHVPPLSARPSLTEPSSNEPASEPGPSGARLMPVRLQRSNSDPPLMQRSPESGPIRTSGSLMDFSKIPQLDSMSAPPIIQLPPNPYKEDTEKRPDTPIRSPDLIQGPNPPEIPTLKLHQIQRDSPEKVRQDTPPKPPPIDIKRAEQHRDSPHPNSMPPGSNLPSLELPPPGQKSVFNYAFSDRGQTRKSAPIRRPDLKPLEDLLLKSPPGSPSQNPPSVPPHINIMTINMNKVKLNDPKTVEKRPPTVGMSTSDSGPGTQHLSQFYPQDQSGLIPRRVQRSTSEGAPQTHGFDVSKSSILPKDDSSEEESDQPGMEREYDPFEEARRVSLLEFQRKSSGAGSSSDAGPSDLHALMMPQPNPSFDNASERSHTFSEAGDSTQQVDDDQQSHSSVDTFLELDNDDTSNASDTDATFNHEERH